jgi:hypothetical protein
VAAGGGSAVPLVRSRPELPASGTADAGSHALDDATACPELERQRVELELLTSLLPLG